jgi:hypothetical protein
MKLHPAVITTAERQGRYWVDVARAYHQWGKPEPCYRALLSAERAAPAEVSYCPPVHRMTKELLRGDRRRSLLDSTPSPAASAFQMPDSRAQLAGGQVVCVDTLNL